MIYPRLTLIGDKLVERLRALVLETVLLVVAHESIMRFKVADPKIAIHRSILPSGRSQGSGRRQVYYARQDVC